MTTKTLFRAFVFTLGSATCGVTLSTSASACGGEWMPFLEIEEVDYRPMVLRQAEKALDEGRYQAAAGMVIRAMPHIKTLDAKHSLVARAQHVLAVAAVRHGGVLPLKLELPERIHGTWLGASTEDRQANLSWAVQALKAVSQHRENDPSLEAELAEAHAALGNHTEAREILERLAKKDLLSTPESWSALARLRGTAGDATGRAAAAKRCAAMARTPATCDLDNSRESAS